MRRIGVFGGSFNPIHNGHIQLGRALCREHGVDELWYVVSPLNPLKAENHELASPEERLAMARLAVKAYPELQVSDVEFSLPKPSYMANTLACLQRSHPTDRFILVIGADNWLCFPHWYHYKEILARHEVWIYPRPGYPLPAELPEGVRKVDTPLYDVSATEVRDLLCKGESVENLVPDSVSAYIRTHHLYGM